MIDVLDKMMIDHEFKFNWQNSMMESYKLYLDKQVFFKMIYLA